MRTTPLALALSASLLTTAGCKEQAPPAADAGRATPAPPQPAAPAAPAAEPEYTIAIEQDGATPPNYTAVWTATVPTGGWTLTTESVLIEEPITDRPTARVFAILEAPAPGEVVTQAFETLTGRHEAGTRVVVAGELSIKRTQRGADPMWLPLYSIVKQTD